MNKVQCFCLFIILSACILFTINRDIITREAKIKYFEKDVSIDRDKIYCAANEMFNEMYFTDEGYLDGYIFNSLTECMLVYQYLEKNISLSGSTRPIIKSVDGGYKIGWEDGLDITKKHEMAKAYVNSLLTSKGSMSVEGIIECIKDDFNIGFDYEYKNRSVYDLIDGSNVGVCTVYSSLFKYLCVQNNINCTVVIGFTNSYHVWNCVTLEDGSKHYYDLTGYCETGDERFLDITNIIYESLYHECTYYEIAMNVGLDY